jgi:hypothetical protein
MNPIIATEHLIWREEGLSYSRPAAYSRVRLFWLKRKLKRLKKDEKKFA